MSAPHTDPPPSYEAVLAHYEELVKKGFPDSVKAKAEEAVTKAIGDSATQQSLVKEVLELSESAINIDRAFQRVSVGLGKVDEQGFPTSDGKELEKLRPQWDEIHQIYKELFLTSRKTAQDTEDYIDEFIQVVLPEVEDALNDPDNEKRREGAAKILDRFMNKTNPNKAIVEGADADKNSAAFQELRRRVEEFKGKFDHFTDKHKEKINQDITRLTGEIQVLEAEISKTDTIITGLGLALGLTAFGTIVGATAALAATGPWAPAVLIGVLIVGIGAAIGELTALIVYIKQRNELRAQVDAKQSQIKDLQKQLELLESIKAGLAAQRQDIDYIAGRLDKFAHVWAMVAHDAREVHAKLKGLSEGIHDPEGSLRRRLNLLKGVYTPLKEALRLYSTTIEQSDALQPKN